MMDLARFPDASTRLIVYGSLVPGGDHHDVVASIPGIWHWGWITGQLRQGGWGADIGYPVLRWDPRGPRVSAHLLESAHLPEHWTRLDEFEGEEYLRILVPFFVDEGTSMVGQVYADRTCPRLSSEGDPRG